MVQLQVWKVPQPSPQNHDQDCTGKYFQVGSGFFLFIEKIDRDKRIIHDHNNIFTSPKILVPTILKLEEKYVVTYIK